MSKNLKVLEVFGEPIANGGQESFVFQVLKHMDLAGLKVDVLTPYDCKNKTYENIVRDLGGNVYSFNLSFEPGKSRNSIYKPLVTFLREHQYDIIHIHSGSISVLALAAAAGKRNHVPRIIVHSHCAAEKKTLKYKIVKNMMMPLLERCPTDYCACSQLASQWKFSKKAQNKVKIIKNGIDLARFRFSEEDRNFIRRKYGIQDSTHVIGHVGRFSYQKNHEFLLRVFSKVYEKEPDTVLLFVGEGELKQEIIRKTKALGLEDRVLFCGNTNQVEKYYSAMDVFALPSRYEGLPIVGVEAQANGLITIVSNNVSRELLLTDQVVFVDLERESEWVHEIIKAKGNIRFDNSLQILSSKGYDIKQTGEEIRRIYMA